MTLQITVENQTHLISHSLKLDICKSHYDRFLGLMFRKYLKSGEGLLFLGSGESRINFSIHMFFMRFRIAAIWLDKDYKIVDMKICYPWRLYYAPEKPAMFLIETTPDIMTEYSKGDILSFSKWE